MQLIMINRTPIRNSYISFICCAAVLSLSLFAGCAPQPLVPPTGLKPLGTVPGRPNFAIVKAGAGDTLSSLASKYLNNPSLDWLIGDFNDITTVTPGEDLIIPLGHYMGGGLTLSGYQSVPVLSYHNFSETKGDKMTVTTSAFEAQMRFLKDNGYRVITMDQLFDFLDFKVQLPKKAVVITIDDGWRSMYDLAFPILKKYGYPATLFIYTDLITGAKKTLNWELIAEMSGNGIDIQCHTKTHRNLALLNEKESFKDYYDTVDRELTESSRVIKEKLNKEVKYLAYPYGATNHLVISLLKKYGFRGAFTIKRGGNPFFSNNYTLNRSMVYGEFDLAQFEKNLTVFSDEALR